MYFLCPMNNWFFNRDNSTVLFVALPHLLKHRLMWWVAANLVVIIQITILFILKFHHNLRWANSQGLSIVIIAKLLLQKTNVNSTFIIINLLICSLTNWNVRFTELPHLSIDRCGRPTINWCCLNYSHWTTMLILVPYTSEKAKLSISVAKIYCRNKVLIVFIESWIDL